MSKQNMYRDKKYNQNKAISKEYCHNLIL